MILGLVAELIILIVSIFLYPYIEDAFKYAARYSGRLSLVIFLLAFYLYAFSYPKPLKENIQLQHTIKLFAILHVIHFVFLAINVYLNAIELVPIKLLGGCAAYLMIIVAPFKLHKLSFIKQLVYFYYVSLVMLLTYVSRIKGDFEGAAPFWFHYVALAVLVSCCVLFGWVLYTSKKKI